MNRFIFQPIFCGMLKVNDILFASMCIKSLCRTKRKECGNSNKLCETYANFVRRPQTRVNCGKCSLSTL